jgi:hypothetical protein
VNQPISRNEAIPIDDLLVHLEVTASVTNQLVEFLESSFVQEKVYAFPRGQFAFGVKLLAALRTAACFGIGVPSPKFINFIHRIFATLGASSS